MDDIVKLLQKEYTNNKLLDKIKSMIIEYKIKEYNETFNNIVQQEIKLKCKTNEHILIMLQHYSFTDYSFSYSIKIQNQSISRVFENGVAKYYVNDILFFSDKEIFNTKPNTMTKFESTIFDKFYKRFCVETNSQISKDDYYYVISDVIIAFGELLGQI